MKVKENTSKCGIHKYNSCGLYLRCKSLDLVILIRLKTAIIFELAIAWRIEKCLTKTIA